MSHFFPSSFGGGFRLQILYHHDPARGFQRSQVQNLFAAHLRDADQMLHFSKRLASYVEPKDASEPVVLHFKDGTEATCDLLVGSDGIRSAVRRTMFTLLAHETESADSEQAAAMRSMIDPEWSGIVAYRGLAPTAALDEDVERETRSVTVVSSYDLQPPASLIEKPSDHRLWVRTR